MHSDKIKLPNNIVKLDDIFRLHPNIQGFMKYFNKVRFKDLGFLIISQPQTHPDIQMYGLFVIDKKSVSRNISSGEQKDPEIKQDFIAYDSKADTYVYYSGAGSKNVKSEHQHIENFCKKYGYWSDGDLGQYSVYKSKGRLKCKDHHHLNEQSPYLPSEKWIRDLVTKELEAVRDDLKKI